MKKLIIAIITIVSISACNKTQNPKEIENKINNYKMQIVDIEGKIKALETQLGDSILESSLNKVLVKQEIIETTNFNHFLDVSGNVEAQTEAFISPEINGLIKSIKVKEGDFVKKGTLLATLDPDMTQRNIDELKTQLDLANTIYSKQKELWSKNIGSEVQFLQAKSNKESLEKRIETLSTQLKMSSIRAPFDGVVEVIYQKEGEIASPGRQMIHFINLDKLKVTADISEAYIPYVHKGDSVLIEFPTFPNLSIKEPIDVISSVVNPNNRTIQISINLSNHKDILKPNVLATIKIKDQFFKNVIVIPSILVKNDANQQNYIYLVDKKENHFFAKKAFITTGQSYGNKTLVTKGLNVGDSLITEGYNIVKNGSLVQLVK